MNKLKIALYTEDDITDYLNKVTLFKSDIDAKRDSYLVDGKSAIAILALIPSKPFVISINTDDKDELNMFNEKFKMYEVA